MVGPEDDDIEANDTESTYSGQDDPMMDPCNSFGFPE